MWLEGLTGQKTVEVGSEQCVGDTEVVMGLNW